MASDTHVRNGKNNKKELSCIMLKSRTKYLQQSQKTYIRNKTDSVHHYTYLNFQYDFQKYIVPFINNEVFIHMFNFWSVNAIQTFAAKSLTSSDSLTLPLECWICFSKQYVIEKCTVGSFS